MFQLFVEANADEFVVAANYFGSGGVEFIDAQAKGELKAFSGGEGGFGLFHSGATLADIDSVPDGRSLIFDENEGASNVVSLVSSSFVHNCILDDGMSPKAF